MKQKSQNYLEKSDGFITLHYVTHDKDASRVIVSVKNTDDNRPFTSTMIKQAKNQGIAFVK